MTVGVEVLVVVKVMFWEWNKLKPVELYTEKLKPYDVESRKIKRYLLLLFFAFNISLGKEYEQDYRFEDYWQY